MDPLKRTTSSTSSRRAGANIAGNSAQFGRSESSLHAERVAASLREARAEGAPGDARTSRQPRDSSSLSSQSSVSDLGFDFALSKSEREQQPASIAPSLASTFHQTTSSTGSDGVLAGPSSKSSDNLAHSTMSPPASGAGKPPHFRAPLRPSLRRPMYKSTPDLMGQSARSPGSPITYQDLGSDYTRYYNPFSDSRRSSWSEKRVSTPRGGRHTTGTTTPLAAVHPANPFLTPNASTTKINTLYDPEKNASVIDDRLIAPYEEKGMAAWPLIGDKEESDDEMHMPRDDDNIRYKPKLRDHFGRDNIASTFGLFFLIVGMLFVFIALPVMSRVGLIDYNSSYGVPLSWFPNPYKSEPWAFVNDREYEFLKNIPLL